MGVLDLVKKHKCEMKPIFTPVGNNMTHDQFLEILSPTYSESTQSKDKEINTFKAMCDFVEELHFKGKKCFIVCFACNKVIAWLWKVSQCWHAYKL